MGFNVPDKLYKLFIVIGVLLVYITKNEISIIKESKFKKDVELFSYEDTLRLLNIQLEFDKDELFQKASDYSLLNETENPIKIVDSLIEFKYVLKGPDNLIKTQLMLKNQWDAYNKTKQKITFFEVKKINFKKQLQKFSEYYENNIKTQRFFLWTGALLFIFGVFSWLNDDIKNDTKKIKPKKIKS